MAYTQPHPRLSVVSTSSQSSLDHLSPTTTSTRLSLPSISPSHTAVPSTKTGLNRPNIYDRNLNKTRGTEVSGAAFAFLFSEIVQYTQKRVSGINDLERQLNTLGYRIGTRVLELMLWRAEGSSKAPKREIKLLSVLMLIHTQVWKATFGKPADAIERSVENPDEYMIIDNDPPIERHISVPRDMSQLSCSSFTAGIVEAVLDGLSFPARVTAHNTSTSQFPNRITILIKLEKSVLDREELLNIDITPSLLNSSCAWSSNLCQLRELYTSAYTGAVTTRTATVDGFQEDSSNHTVAFATESVTTINSYGYSPHPLIDYLAWVEAIFTSYPSSTKPVIISITDSDPVVLQSMVQCIQELRFKLHDTNPGKPGTSKIAIELNTSCPNIPNSPPSGYSFKSLLPLLCVLRDAFAQDMTLTIGLKLPPYVSKDQFTEVITTLQSLVISNANKAPTSAFAFLTCTNTLGNSLLFSNQTTTDSGPTFAVPTVLGGVAGETLHPLALGNVFTFKQLLSSNEAVTKGLGDVKIIGVGGVTSKDAASRMRQAGADVVGCATLLGKEGVRAFEILSKT